MATMSTLIERVRLELGDLGKSFAESIIADGTTNRFQLQYQPLDSASVTVSDDGVNVTAYAHVEESTGVVVLTDTSANPDVAVIPTAGSVLLFNGTHYRYFTDDELAEIITTAVSQHSAKHIDSLGRPLSLVNLPTLEEYPVAVYATVMALYTLATDASFDIDIMAPDGVSIPRSERYRQLMQMIQLRQDHYRDLCVHLGVGLYSIDVFSFRRISKTTNRYVPVYKPQEVDDRSIAQRVEMSIPTYGDANVPWVTEAGQLLAYQDIAFEGEVTFTGDYAGYSFLARVVTQRGSKYKIQPFTLSVDGAGESRVITDAERTNGNALTTLTTSEAHTIVAGDFVYITGLEDNDVPPGKYLVQSGVTSTTFKVNTPSTDALDVSDLEGQADVSGTYDFTAYLSLTRDQTKLMPGRTWWQVVSVNPVTGEEIEIIGGDFFVRKSYTAIL